MHATEERVLDTHLFRPGGAVLCHLLAQPFDHRHQKREGLSGARGSIHCYVFAFTKQRNDRLLDGRCLCEAVRVEHMERLRRHAIHFRKQVHGLRVSDATTISKEHSMKQQLRLLIAWLPPNRESVAKAHLDASGNLVTNRYPCIAKPRTLRSHFLASI